MRYGYFVLTWDAEEQKFTPQIGVSPGPYTLFGLRSALRILRNCGYVARGEDPWILVEKRPLEVSNADNPGAD